MPRCRRQSSGLGSAQKYKVYRYNVKPANPPQQLPQQGLLQLIPKGENRTWYRMVGSQFETSAIATRHTIAVPSRFYDPLTTQMPFSSLYVSDNPLVAMFEAQALFGSPTIPGGTVPAPA